MLEASPTQSLAVPVMLKILGVSFLFSLLLRESHLPQEAPNDSTEAHGTSKLPRDDAARLTSKSQGASDRS